MVLVSDVSLHGLFRLVCLLKVNLYEVVDANVPHVIKPELIIMKLCVFSLVIYSYIPEILLLQFAPL